MKKDDKPRISIGMPVYNGEKHLKQAIDSILAQTFPYFELIISDNASTDRTREICLEYASKDSRVHYYRNKQNFGAANNHNRVFELSRGEYFKWAAHDDVLTPEFLARCLNVIDRDPTIVLCHSKTGRINGNGKLIGKYDTMTKFDSFKTHERFGSAITFSNNAWVSLFGLMRPNMLKTTRLFGCYIGSDRNLLAEISLAGRISETPEVLFFRREHSLAYTNKEHKSYQEQLAWWTKINSPKLVFPYWRRYREYFNSVRRMHLKWSERQMCYAQIFKRLIAEGWLLLDLDIAANLSMHLFANHYYVRSWLGRSARSFLRRGGIF
jgi:glycosyltransferase involved in cell wall biosynthesis